MTKAMTDEATRFTRYPNSAFWSGRSVLVTGHTGFKGAWLSLWLTHLGARVSGFSLAPPSELNLYKLANLSRYMSSRYGDVCDLISLSANLEDTKPSIIIHLAAQALVRHSYNDPVGTYATNVMGTVNLLEAVRTCSSVEAVIIVTSDKAYENREWVWAYRESEAMGGYDPYSSSKGCAELVTNAFRKSYFSGDGCSVKIASARAGNVIGGGDWSKDRLIPDIMKAFSRGEPVEIRAPNSVRPWQHVLEPLSGYLRLAELLCDVDGARYAEAWNFGPSEADCRPVGDLLTRIAHNWGEGADWRLASGAQPHEATFLKVDASKAQSYLGWYQRLNLTKTIKWTVGWYRDQGRGEDAKSLTMQQIKDYEDLVLDRY